jgi:hypothetical protein
VLEDLVLSFLLRLFSRDTNEVEGLGIDGNIDKDSLLTLFERVRKMREKRLSLSSALSASCPSRGFGLLLVVTKPRTLGVQISAMKRPNRSRAGITTNTRDRGVSCSSS